MIVCINVRIVHFRLIQEEKENTEARAEELEYRVSSLDHIVVGSHLSVANNHSNHNNQQQQQQQQQQAVGGVVGVANSGRSTPRVAPQSQPTHSPVTSATGGYSNNASSPMTNANSPQRDYLQKFHTVNIVLHF